MPNDTISQANQPKPHKILYDHKNPSPHFTKEQIAYIESIQDDFSPEDVEKIRKLERFLINLNVSGIGENSIPGLRKKPGMDSAYIRRYSDEKYLDMMNKFFRYVPDDFPRSEVGKCIMYAYRVTVPNGDRYYPVTFHGAVELWHKRLLDNADHFNTLIGRFNRGNFLVSNGEIFDFGQINLETLDSMRYPKNW